MIIPIVTGDGRRIDLDSDDYPRAVLAEACEGILPELWGLFASGGITDPAAARAEPYPWRRSHDRREGEPANGK